MMSQEWIIKRFLLSCCLLCAALTFLTTARAKPTLSFQLPSSLTQLPAFVSITQFVERKRSTTTNDIMKSYSGQRIRSDSLLMVYYHDQTIAIAELGPVKSLLGCELIEIYNDDDGVALLKELSKNINKPYKINFREMVKLMQQCEKVDGQRNRSTGKKLQKHQAEYQQDQPATDIKSQLLQGNYFAGTSLFKGIIPGTKWCGTGDIAENYHDLGTETEMDMCCRTHDLCPVKVRAYQKRYDLNNDSLYTKSHCTCDDMLFSCLKKTNTSTAHLMGSIYFNLVQVPCVQETSNGRAFRRAKEGF